MKIKLYNILLAAGLLFLASCSSDDDNTGKTPDNQVKFKVETSQMSTKSVTLTDGTFKSTFETGDAIGIYAVKRTSSGSASLLATGNYADNVKYVKQSNGEWTAALPIVYPADGDVLDFYAYYPYDADITDATAIAFNVLADQSADITEKSDLMTSKDVSAVVTNNEVTLTFGHQLALVQLEVVATTSDIDLQQYLASATLKNVVPDITFDLNDGAIINGTTASDVLMRKVDDGSSTSSALYWALVPAQTIANGTDLFNLNYTGKGDYGYNLSQDVTLQKGSVKKFKLTISGDNTSLTIISAGTGVDDWNSGNTDSGEDVSVE